MTIRKTGLQKDVLKLYKDYLRMIKQKPLDTRPSWFQYAANQFRHSDFGGGLNPKDFQGIEFLLRRGRKNLDQLGSASIKKVTLPQSAQLYHRGWVARGGKDRNKLQSL